MPDEKTHCSECFRKLRPKHFHRYQGTLTLWLGHARDCMGSGIHGPDITAEEAKKARALSNR